MNCIFKAFLAVTILSAISCPSVFCTESELDIGESKCNQFSLPKQTTTALQPMVFQIDNYIRKSDQYHQIEKRLRRAGNSGNYTFSFWVAKSHGGIIATISDESFNMRIDPYIRNLVTKLPSVQMPLPSEIRGICVRVKFSVMDGKVNSLLEVEHVVFKNISDS